MKKKPARCPRFHWDLQKIVVLLQRELRFLFLHLWKFRTVLGGLDKMKCTCRCGKTVIFVDHNSSEVRFQKNQNEWTKNSVNYSGFMFGLHVWILKKRESATPVSGPFGSFWSCETVKIFDLILFLSSMASTQDFLASIQAIIWLHQLLFNFYNYLVGNMLV